MAGIEDLVGYFPRRAPVANALGFTKTVYDPPELPSVAGKDDEQGYSVEAKNPFFGLPRSTIPNDLPASIKAFRADPINRFGGNDGLETLPMTRLLTGGNSVGKVQMYKPDLNPETSTIYTNPSKAVQELYRYARTNGAAAANGLPSLSTEDLGALLLKEGRTDLGAGGVHDKYTEEFRNKVLNKYDLTRKDITFLSLLQNKQRLAKLHNIPFAMAWNGTGDNGVGQTGRQYAENYEAHKQAVAHPKNQELMALINRGMEDGQKYGFALREDRVKNQMSKRKQVPYKKGGMVDKPLAGGAKMI